MWIVCNKRFSHCRKWWPAISICSTAFDWTAQHNNNRTKPYIQLRCWCMQQWNLYDIPSSMNYVVKLMFVYPYFMTHTHAYQIWITGRTQRHSRAHSSHTHTHTHQLLHFLFSVLLVSWAHKAYGGVWECFCAHHIHSNILASNRNDGKSCFDINY